jgi:hypothetical protein
MASAGAVVTSDTRVTQGEKMAYQANKPLATDQLSVSQVDLNNNFQAIASWAAVDHATLNSPAEGHHYFNVVGAIPTNPTATQVALYAKNDPAGLPDLYMGRLVGGVLVESNPLFGANSGGTNWTTLPGGLIMQWGTGTIPYGQMSVWVPLNIAGFKVFPTAILNIQLTANTMGVLNVNDLVMRAGNSTTGGFYVTKAQNGTLNIALPFYFLVLGN